MKVLVAGSTGALGIPTVRALIKEGHDVVGLTRSQDKAIRLEELGASVAHGDVLDEEAMLRVMERVRPQGVLQLLNALPKRGPLRPRELEGTNRLRVVGTKNLLSAATAAGVKRFVTESMIFGYGYGHVRDRLVTEEDPFGGPVSFPPAQPAIDALNFLEDQVLEASTSGAIEGVVLRYGLFYGPGVGSTEFMVTLLKRGLFILPGGGHAVGSWIHVEDGASAAATALEDAPAGSVFNVVDDEPVPLRDFAQRLAETLDLRQPRSVPMWAARILGTYAHAMARSRLPVSNERIKRDLGWSPRHPTYREGSASLRSTSRVPGVP
ncbi:MAG: NAD(P)-dependent oxidoreductase [Actinomycetota bacterium]|nr:NAD(P)-dependent oxidoreductase [Actinomycetota bacterium]